MLLLTIRVGEVDERKAANTEPSFLGLGSLPLEAEQHAEADGDGKAQGEPMERNHAPPAAVYHPRNPQSSDYYRCVEDYFEPFIGIYDEHFSRQYGFYRPYQIKNLRQPI
jgi:hypothetical protein